MSPSAPASTSPSGPRFGSLTHSAETHSAVRHSACAGREPFPDLVTTLSSSRAAAARRICSSVKYSAPAVLGAGAGAGSFFFFLGGASTCRAALVSAHER